MQRGLNSTWVNGGLWNVCHLIRRNVSFCLNNGFLKSSMNINLSNEKQNCGLVYTYTYQDKFSRCFATEANSSCDAVANTVEGRYASALFSVAEKNNCLDNVFLDSTALLEGLKASNDLRIFANTPGVTTEQKIDVIKAMGDKFKLNRISVNFLFTLVENRRMSELPKILNIFEELCRRKKGEIKCIVTSAAALTSTQKNELLAALQKRSGLKSKLIVEYTTFPGMIGGLMVQLGNEVLDFSVSSRLEGLRSQLTQPVA